MAMNITILGMGAMGSRMAERLEGADHTVTRWNRSGAAQTPRAAVAGAEVVIAMVRDDAASAAVWLGTDGALAGLQPDALAIESSTLSVDWVKALAVEMHAAGRAFIDAPVIGSRPQADAGQLIHLIGGADDEVARAMPVLAAMSGLQLHAGPVGSGAALKLIANALFGIQVATMAELQGRMPALGLEPATAMALLGQTPLVSPAAKGAAGLMLADRHEPMFPVELVAKDFGYAIGGAGDAMPVTRAALSVFEQAIGKGWADENLTVVARQYLPEPCRPMARGSG
jgi:3-hydroxyisobutyrate dehydrogenase